MGLELGFDPTKLSPGKKNLALLLPSILIIGLTVYLLILPLNNERVKLVQEIEKQKSDIASAQQAAARLPQLKAENTRLAAILKELQLQLPVEKEVSTLLRQASELGISAGLKVALWKPKPKKPHSSGEIYEIPVDVEMRGAYHDLGRFFSSISKLNRIMNIDNIDMRLIDPKTLDKKIRKPGQGILTVTFNAITYSAMSDAERGLMLETKKKEEEAKKAAEKK
jgi:type IV pilus assembly protein PilO